MPYDVTTLPDGVVRISFERESDYGVYRSSLALSQTEYTLLSDIAIEGLIEQHLAAWLAMVTPPPDPEE